MGQYYKIVNVKKKQYLNPHAFGSGAKLMEFGVDGMSIMAGLAILLADGNGRGEGDLNSDNPIVGSWAGDNIVIAGDYADNGKWVKEDINLYTAAVNQGEDISYKVIEALFDDRFFFDEFRKNPIHLDDKTKELIERTLVKKGMKLPQSWAVPSSKDVSVLYTVKEDNGVWECSCPSFLYSSGKDCKHITSIKTK